MKQRITLLHSIPIELPRESIYRRMGYRKHFTQIDKETEAKIEEQMKRAFSEVELKGMYTIFDQFSISGEKIHLNDNLIIESADFIKLIENARQIALFICTAGNRIMQAINTLHEESSLSQMLLYDAVGSETVEAAANYIHNFIGRQVERKGLRIAKRRFSPGYGDMIIQTQQQIFDFMEPEKIGISLTDSCIMQPEKSITALVGLHENLG